MTRNISSVTFTSQSKRSGAICTQRRCKQSTETCSSEPYITVGTHGSTVSEVSYMNTGCMQGRAVKDHEIVICLWIEKIKIRDIQASRVSSEW
ncbi:hypothetical protein J6590_035447 [Homalodisca vitripennis]|nr:hypothetical protein J6590_035447 [Homalodisca vitripennis]